MKPKKSGKKFGNLMVMPSPAMTFHSNFSMLSAHSAYSEGAVEAIMRSQPLATKYSRLKDNNKKDVLKTPMTAPRVIHNLERLKQLRLIQIAVVLFFATFYVGSLGMIYVAPKIGGRGNMIGFLMGLADATASIYSGLVSYRIGEDATFKLFAIVGAAAIMLLYYNRDFLLGGTASLLGYSIYYIGMVGWGGCFNVLFLIAEKETPPDMLGATFSLGMACGLLAASMSPQIAMLEMPQPLLVFNGIILFDLLIVTWLTNNSYRKYNSSDRVEIRTEMLKLRDNEQNH
jgi:hypothetical protein